MNRSPARILAQYLIDEGEAFLAQNVDWCVQVNSMPAEKPDKRIAIYSTFARDAGTVLRTGQTIYHPGLQVSVRAPDDEDSFDKAKKIQDKLDAIVKGTVVTIGGDVYNLQSFDTLNPPFFLKQEEKNLRRYYIINGNLTYEEII